VRPANEIVKTTAHDVSSQSGQFVRELAQRVFVSRSLTEPKAILFVIAFASLLILPIVVWGIPEGGDLANHYRFALPFYESFQNGDLYPGWLSESNAGYGDPRFRFYPPGFYYLLAACKMFAGWYGATVLAFALLSIAGSLGVYFWTRNFLPPAQAMLAGLFYAVAPYHLNELYQASLLSEYAGCAVLPFVFAFIDRVCARRRLVDVSGLGASYALLILTNLPLAVIGSISALVFGIVRTDRKALAQTFLRLGAGVVLGLVASAFFWVRMVSELSWIKGSGVDPRRYYDYRVNFILSPEALTNRNTWYANLLALTTIAFLLPAIVLIRKDRRFIPIAIVTLFSFFMSLRLSKPIWAVIPRLSEVQFPWRWLAVMSLTGSVLLGASVSRWTELFKSRIRPLHLLPLLGLTLSLGFVATQIVWDSNYLSRRQFDGFLPTIRGAVSFKDWLPVSARQIVELPNMLANVEAQSRQITTEVWTPEYRKFRVADGPNEEMRVKTYYYPNWIATTGGVRLSVRSSADGVMLVTIPPGPTTVDLRFREPVKVRIAGIVSGLSWIAILAIVILNRRRNTKGELKNTI